MVMAMVMVMINDDVMVMVMMMVMISDDVMM